MKIIESAVPGNNIIVLAGATGDLGSRIAQELRKRGATVRAIVRPESNAAKVKALQAMGCIITETDYTDISALKSACQGAGCVVSALSGLREVIVDAQTLLLKAAVKA